LQNAIGLLVIVQCKRYAAHCHVRPAEIREFGGTIHLHDAVYGYFVTTSTFTPAAYRDRDSHGRIHTLNGQHLEMLLQRHPREIAQALDDIRKSMKDAFQV
jgi:restriction endonuclease Mrr